MDFSAFNVPTLKSMLKDAGMVTHHPEIQKVLATKAEKPAYTFKPKFSEKGGIYLPMVLYRNSAEQMIQSLQGLLEDPRWKPYSK